MYSLMKGNKEIEYGCTFEKVEGLLLKEPQGMKVLASFRMFRLKKIQVSGTNHIIFLIIRSFS